MDVLHQTDLMLRGGGIAVLLLCALVALRTAPRSRLAWALAAVAAGLVVVLFLSFFVFYCNFYCFVGCCLWFGTKFLLNVFISQVDNEYVSHQTFC